MRDNEPKRPPVSIAIVTLATVAAAIVVIFVVGWLFSDPTQNLPVVPVNPTTQ